MGRMRAAMALVGVATGTMATGCGGDDGEAERGDAELPEAEEVIVVNSPAFGDGEAIPERLTCDGEDVSPALAWTSVPDGIEELAIVLVDPGADGGSFAHWGVWGIPSTTADLAEGELPDGARETVNGFDTAGWAGPCPPEGDDPHTYELTVLALSEAVDLDDDATVEDLVEAVGDTVTARGSLTGTYGR